MNGIASVALRLAALWLLVAGQAGAAWLSAPTAATVSGTVIDASGPVDGATVRVRNTDNFTTTSAGGAFTLGSLAEGVDVEVTAWADGCYVAYIYVTPPAAGITLALRRYHTTDHPDYEWLSPIAGAAPLACGNCHPMIVDQWISNGHGRATFNPRFYSLYNGTDLSGAEPVGPGYKIDFPGTAGTCANCHAPGAGVDGYLTTDMNAVRDDVKATIQCDYCHKIGGVYLNPATGSVYPNAPGVRSQRILRPPAGDQIFLGPYDDIHDPDTRLPLISESAYCAPCHQFSMWGTPIYQSFAEWLASPYAAQGITCQKCHMPPNGDTTFALPEVGGLEHPPERIPSHLDRGALDVALLRNSVAMTVTARQVDGRIEATVTITNIQVGHHVPTDHPGRQMILTVRAVDAQGHDLARRSGPVVPAWGGAQAGWSGKAYAKILQDVATDEAPVVSYWKQTRILSDNRLPALQSDATTYTFAAPAGGGEVAVKAELRFRRAFQALMDAKGWDTPDITMEEEQVRVAAPPSYGLWLPVVSR